MSAEIPLLDVIIVGAGFSGLYTLYKLRNEGFKTKVLEAGSGLGGVWYWNCYPGARVDSENQVYQFGIEGLWKDFDWTERYPGRDEVLRYFQHAEEKLNLSKDVTFNTHVTSAQFNDETNQWLVSTDSGSKYFTRNIILCTGLAAKRYTPPFKGLENFKGETYHTGVWPQNGVDLKDKRVAIIGTGASAVQVIQEIGPIVSHLTVYQRTPNFALPMRQYKAIDENRWKPTDFDQSQVFNRRKETFAGFDNLDFVKLNAVDCTEEEREAFYEGLYQSGGFGLWLATYQDVIFNSEANETAYKFWCKKTRARVTDPIKRDLVAPLEPPHPFGTKRPSLEQNYYEVLNQENIEIINVRESPIIQIAQKGVETQKEGVVEVDVLILATGFDALTGGIMSIDISNGKGEKLEDKWRQGSSTYLGMTVAGYPNLFYIYGPGSPNAFSNGPTSTDVQGDWIFDFLVYLRDRNISKFEAEESAENKWTQTVRDLWADSLFPLADSWYQGANIPGKRREALAYIAGMPAYVKVLAGIAANQYEGFVTA